MRRSGCMLLLSFSLFLGGCDWILSTSIEFKVMQGLKAAIDHGVSPFQWSEVLPQGVTEICYFGPYDDGDDLKLTNNNFETSWVLVAFRGDAMVAQIHGHDRQHPFPFQVDNVLQIASERGCFTPDARITILGKRTLRFEDREDYRPRK